MDSNVNALNGVNASGTFQYNPYAASDFDDLDIDYSMYPMGMNGSIFSGYGGFATPMASPMMGMGGYSNQDYFNNMKEYQKFNIDYNVDQQKMQRNADLRINASVEGVQGAAANLKDKILQNEQDQIQEAYKAYVDSVRAAYGDGTEQEVQSRAKSLYAQMNGGKTLVQDLRDNSHGSFTQGLLQTLTLGAYCRHSSEDNISKITGQPVGSGEKTSQNFGRVSGSGIFGGIAYGLAKAAKFKKAGIIGLATGAIAATMSFITGKVTA